MQHLSDYDFTLPEDLIALRPVRPRRAARMLVQDGADRHHAHMRDLPTFLRPGDMLVFNDTRVLPARLSGRRRRGDAVAAVEVTLATDLGGGVWTGLARPARKLRTGDAVSFGADLSATVVCDPVDGLVTLRFALSDDALVAAVHAAGAMPLPPYIANRRAVDADDQRQYQSIFARNDGAVAAPTASLHFDTPLMESLSAAGITHRFVTLHVGIGTFLPVKTEVVADHRMHAEWGQISAGVAADLTAARNAGGRIIAVGTTALRLLESAADSDGRIHAYSGNTDIFIRPGHAFLGADGLITNFHLPRSTLLMLVSALIGFDRTKEMYQAAISAGYRFYSYGDGSLLLP